MTTHTVTPAAPAVDFADFLNTLTVRGSGVTVRVNDRLVKSLHGPAARSWANGSLSVNVAGRSKGTQGTVWVKAGQRFSVTVEVAADAELSTDYQRQALAYLTKGSNA